MRVVSREDRKNTFSAIEHGYLTWEQPLGIYMNAAGYLGMGKRVVLL